jgi:hypothetical protein
MIYVKGQVEEKQLKESVPTLKHFLKQQQRKVSGKFIEEKIG